VLPVSLARFGERSAVLDWLRGEGARWFDELAPDMTLEPGDVLAVTISRFPHHLALFLPGGRVIHAMDPHGVQILDDLPGSLSRRLTAVFRLRKRPWE
jgi:cell wall-associated NlpC family hydrolase